MESHERYRQHFQDKSLVEQRLQLENPRLEAAQRERIWAIAAVAAPITPPRTHHGSLIFVANASPCFLPGSPG